MDLDFFLMFSTCASFLLLGFASVYQADHKRPIWSLYRQKRWGYRLRAVALVAAVFHRALFYVGNGCFDGHFAQYSGAICHLGCALPPSKNLVWTAVVHNGVVFEHCHQPGSVPDHGDHVLAHHDSCAKREIIPTRDGDSHEHCCAGLPSSML